MTVRVAVLISGSGTNLQALIDTAASSDCPAEIVLVLSNKEGAYGLSRARTAGIDAVWHDHRGKPRATYDQEVADILRRNRVDWVFLAGFMRLLSPVLLEAFPGRVVNIHPALLPSFPGLQAQKQAFDAGVRVSGATVHFVDAGMDTGAIIAQGTVCRKDDDTLDDFSARILTMEHRLFPMVMRWAAEGRLALRGGEAVVSLATGESRSLLDS